MAELTPTYLEALAAERLKRLEALITRAFDEFEDESGAVMCWRLTCAPFAFGSGARAALAKHVAQCLHQDGS